MSQEMIQEKEYTEVSDPTVMALTPLVSVLMITYNHGPYLADAIEGVIAQQTDFPIELLIGEDCSTDNTREVALDYQRRYPQLIRVIYSEKNVGAALNFKRIVMESRGEYAALCEGDDWWCNPKKLQLQIEIFKSDPTIGAVHSDHAYARMIKNKWVVTHKNGRWFSKALSFPITGNLFPTVFRNCCLATNTVVYKGIIIKEYVFSNFFDPFALVLDIVLAAYCCSRWQIAFLDQVVSVYRLSPNSATRSGFHTSLKNIKSIIFAYEKMYQHYGHRNDFDFLFSDTVYINYIKTAFLTGDIQLFSGAIHHVSKNKPEILLCSDIRIRRLLARYSLVYKTTLLIARLRDKYRLLKDKITLYFGLYSYP